MPTKAAATKLKCERRRRASLSSRSSSEFPVWASINSKALSGVSGKLTEEVQLLASVREAVELERNEPDRLHKIDVAATALDQLVQEYGRQKQELETEIAARRAAWEEEAAGAEREEELARLRREAEAKDASERARRESEARQQQEILVMKKDAEAEKRFGELRVKTLEETAAHHLAQIAALEKQLADAKQQVQDIAVKAIEGASGARALSHINQIAMEQAKNRPQG